MRARAVVLAVGAAIAVAVMPVMAAASTEDLTFSSRGMERHAFISHPSGVKTTPPVILLFPREGTSAADAINRFGSAINRVGAVAVGLDALPCASLGNQPCWAPLQAGGRRATDILAVGELLDILDRRTDMDTVRLVSVGESSGAAFAVTMTTTLPGRIDGALAISGFDPTRTVVLDGLAQVRFPLQLTGHSTIAAPRNRAPITIVRGSADAMVSPALSADLRKRLAAKGWGSTVAMVTVGGAVHASGDFSAAGRITPRLRDLLQSAFALHTSEGLVHRLAQLGYLSENVTVGDTSPDAVEQALMAFQGWSGLTRDGALGAATRELLMIADRPVAPRTPKGRIVEVSIDKQVMLLVDNGRTVRAIHISSGAAGNTPRGDFTVLRKEMMSWSRPFSTWMPYASYFIGGYAFHEHPYVPGYPASHGCIRIASPNAPTVYEFATYTTPVFVY